MMTFGSETRLFEQADLPIVEGMTNEQIGALHQGEV